MAEYSNLSATINAQIRANGVQAITGPVLNAVLTAMVNVLGDGYRLKGVAAPADNPGSPDNRVAYLAAQDGTYTNFGGLTISGEVALLLWDSAWTKEVLFSIDTAVTPGSGHLVTSGAVDDALTTLAGNISAAYMRLVPGATEDNLASYDNAGQVKDSGIAAADVVKKDGVYPDLYAGYAGNLVDTRSAGTPQGPYAFRQSGGDGVDYMVRIKGKTEAFNQLVQNGNFENTTDSWIKTANINISVNNNVASVTASADGDNFVQQTLSLVVGHKYYVKVETRSTSPSDIVFYCFYGSGGDYYVLNGGSSDSFIKQRRVITCASNQYNLIRLACQSVSITNYYRNVMVIDLTLMYGAGNEPATPEAFEALHPLGYYSPASKLINNAATGIKTTGFNQWDEEWESGRYNQSGEKMADATRIRGKNKIKVIAGQTYYVNGPLSSSADFNYVVFDASGNAFGGLHFISAAGTITMPSGADSIVFYLGVGYGTTYNHDICINISDASRNGTYEPYWERTLALGLNSIACHDENNNAVVVNGLDGVGSSYDEAVVENGMVTKIIKRRGRRAYQAGDESDATLITDGTNTDYPLATPLTLTVDTPFPAFVEVDNLGTQERLPADTAADPQGGFESDSNYSVSTANLVRLLNL